MDENEKRAMWIRFHQIQLATAFSVGKTDFDYSTNDPLFLEMMQVRFPHYLREYLIKNPVSQLDICAVGSGIRPEFLPVLKDIKNTYPELEVNAFCIDHVFWQNDARLLLLSTIARELSLPDIDPQIQPVTKRDSWSKYQLDLLTVYVSKFFHQDFSLPKTSENVVVTLFHAINYLDANDVIKFLEDKRVKTICIANGETRGYSHLFHSERFRDFFDSNTALRQLGFNLDQFHQEKNMRNYTAIYSR